KRLAAMGASVTLVGRTIERLQTAATEIGRTSDCDIVEADVGDAGAVRRAFDTVDKRGRVLRMLINNAGSATSAKFTETDWPVWEEMLRVNLNGAYDWSHQARPCSTSAGGGRAAT